MTNKLKPEQRLEVIRLAADKGTHHMDDNQRDLLLQIMAIELLEVSTALSLLVGDLDDSTDQFHEAWKLRNHISDNVGWYGTLNEGATDDD